MYFDLFTVGIKQMICCNFIPAKWASWEREGTNSASQPFSKLLPTPGTEHYYHYHSSRIKWASWEREGTNSASQPLSKRSIMWATQPGERGHKLSITTTLPPSEGLLCNKTGLSGCPGRERSQTQNHSYSASPSPPPSHD